MMDNELRDKLIKLETQLEERRIRSDEKHAESLSKFDAIFKKLDCVIGLKASVNRLWFLVTVVIIGGIVLGIWVKIAMSAN